MSTELKEQIIELTHPEVERGLCGLVIGTVCSGRTTLLKLMHLVWKELGESIFIPEGHDFRLGALALAKSPSRPFLVTLDHVEKKDLLKAVVLAPGVSFWASLVLSRVSVLRKTPAIVEEVLVDETFQKFDVVLLTRTNKDHQVEVTVIKNRSAVKNFTVDPREVYSSWQDAAKDLKSPVLFTKVATQNA